MAPQDNALFRAVRHGDLERIKYLIEIEGMTAHQFDQWQATPLYYAALCGHKEIIQYLLSSGARCDEKTFDGERCFYVALNDEVRRLLRDEGFKKGAARGHDLYLDFVQHLLNDLGSFPDIVYTTGSGELFFHKCIIHARCPGLLQLLAATFHFQKSESTWEINHETTSLPFYLLSPLVRWCYTGRLEVQMDSVENMLLFLRQASAYQLATYLQQCEEATPGILGTVVVEPARSEIKEDLQHSMRLLQKQAWHYDLEILVEGGSVLFRGHKAILCVRSLYFSALVASPFADTENGKTIVNLTDVSERVMFQMLCWAYTDAIPEQQDGQLLLQVLKVADRFLVDGLKNCCTLLLTPFVNCSNAVVMLQEAMQMNNERLVDICCRCIAQDLLQAVKDSLFIQLVKESAESVVEREEVDSVPIIDEIRYHLDQLHVDDIDSDDEDEDDIVIQPSQRQIKLMALDEMLFEIGIEA